MIILSHGLSKLVFFSIFVGVAFPHSALGAGQSAPVLRPKYKVEQPAPPPPVLRPKRVSQDGVNEGVDEEEQEPVRSEPKTPLRATTLSLLVTTPLIHENTFDGRFKAYGLWVALAFPLFHLPWHGTAYLETGPAATYASVALLQPAVNFSHIYLNTPIRFRTVFMASSHWEWELAAGLQVKWFEYDSRPTTDGGFRMVSKIFSNIDPDFAIGAMYRLSPGFRLRLTAGFLYLGVGTEFNL